VTEGGSGCQGAPTATGVNESLRAARVGLRQGGRAYFGGVLSVSPGDGDGGGVGPGVFEPGLVGLDFGVVVVGVGEVLVGVVGVNFGVVDVGVGEVLLGVVEVDVGVVEVLVGVAEVDLGLVDVSEDRDRVSSPSAPRTEPCESRGTGLTSR